MGILNRNMFNRGGYTRHGTGIASGLATPKRGYVDEPGSYAGDLTDIEEIKKRQKEYHAMLEELGLAKEAPSISKRELYGPALMSLFGGMMSGKSLQGGWGGAFDILGQATQQSASLFLEADKTKRAYEAAVADDQNLQLKALDYAREDLAKDETDEKWTAGDSFQAKIPIHEDTDGDGVDDSISYVTRELTRFTSSLGNIKFTDPMGVDHTKFTPLEVAKTFQGPDNYEYEMKEVDGVMTAVKIPGQEAPVEKPGDVQTFQAKDGYEYMIRVDPASGDVEAVRIPGQADVEEPAQLFKGPDGYTYMLNADGKAEVIPGQGAPEKAPTIFTSKDGYKYMLDEASGSAVLIPGQAEVEDAPQTFEGPDGKQYNVIDGQAEIIPGQADKIPSAPSRAMFFNETWRSKSNPSGVRPAFFEYDDVKEKWRWTYDDVDGTRKILPMEGSVQVSVTGPMGDLQSAVVTVRNQLATSEINTRQAMATIDSALAYFADNPDANTITSAIAAFTNEVKAEIRAAFRAIGKGEIENQGVLDIATYDSLWARMGIANEVLQSKFLDLAYIVAAARDQTGRALSDKDISRFIEIIGGDSANFPTVAATLNDVKNRLAGEYAIQHNVLADIYEGIEKIPDDFLLSPIGEARTEEGKLINPFDLDLFDEIDAETQ
jgi:hypothetical protein